MQRRSRVGLAFGLVLGLSLVGSIQPAKPAGFVSATVMPRTSWQFGGFSAIRLSADGQRFIALSDRGRFLHGLIARDKEGRTTTVSVGSISSLRGKTRDQLSDAQADSEGIALGPGERVCISFEIDIRVACYDPIDGKPIRLPQNPAFALLPANGALEALAIDAKGVLFAVPENPPDSALPVYVFRDGTWDPSVTRLSRSAGFRPVDADFGPDGRFYLLERRFHGLRGFSSRVRRFDLGIDGFSSGETLLQTPPGLHDNLEGLSIWRAPDGLRATMISDDNFLPIQRTEIVEYRLPD